MELALLGSDLPSRASAPWIGPGFDRPGARGAADAGESSRMKGVDGHVILADVAEHVLPAPIRERTDLPNPTVHPIARESLDDRAVEGLLAPQSNDPRGGAFERPVQRMDLPDLTTRLSVLDRLVELVWALARDQLLHFLRIGEDDLDWQPEPVPGLLHELVRLFEQPAGVEGDDPDAA